MVERVEERPIDAEREERQIRRRSARRHDEVVDDVAENVVSGRRAASEEEDAAGGVGTGNGEAAAETAAEREGNGRRLHIGKLTHRVRAESPPKRVSASRNAYRTCPPTKSRKALKRATTASRQVGALDDTG